MQTIRTGFILLVALVLAFGLVLATAPTTVLAKTITVCEVDCDHVTISAAIAAAGIGDTITVAAGTYNENIVINKSLTIHGAGLASTFINGVGTGANISVVNITAPGNVSISGFTITNPPTSIASDLRFGILTNSAFADVTYTITNNKVIGTNNATNEEDYGIYGQNGGKENLIITGNVVTQTGANNIVVEAHQGTTTISNNTLDAGVYGTDSIFIMTHSGKDVSSLQSITGNTIDLGTATGLGNHTGVSIAAVGPFFGVDPAKFLAGSISISGNTIINAGPKGRGIGFWNDAAAPGTGGEIIAPVVTNNTITAVSGNPTGSFGIDTIGLTNGALITDNTVSNFEYCYKERTWNDHVAVGTVLEDNDFVNCTYGAMTDRTTGSLDASPNWWGSVSGPTVSQVVGPVTYDPWCMDSSCVSTATGNEAGEVLLPATVTPSQIQAALNSALPGTTLIIPEGSYQKTGAFNITTNNLTIKLADGAVIQNNSPCFVVDADNVTVTTASISGGICRPTGNSHGIDVLAGSDGVTVAGLEIDGASQTAGNGIHFAGPVAGVAIVDNFIHGIKGDAVFFTNTPTGTVDIHGNLFQGNTGVGISNIGTGAAPLDATYNSWGDYTGPAGANGDGVSANVTFDPWTHAALTITSSGSPWVNQVVTGSNIAYTVYADLKNVNTADFTLSYPANLSIAITPIAKGGIFESETITHNASTRTINYLGANIGLGEVEDGSALPLFTVTFTGGSLAVNSPLDLSLTPVTGGFGMPGASSSTNIYPAAIGDGLVTVIARPTLTSDDIDGYYLTGDVQTFNLAVNNANGGNFTASVVYDFTIQNAELADITSLSCNFTGTPMDVKAVLAQSGADLIGRVNLGFTMAPNFSETIPCTVNFAAPGSYSFNVVLVDSAPNPDFALATLTQSAVVYTKPTLSSTDLDGPYLVGIPQSFTVTVNDPSDIPAPIELTLTLPEGTILSYGGTTYPCTGGVCSVPVALAAAVNNFTFSVTFVAPFSGSVTAKLWDTDWTPAVRELATASISSVAYANFSITGTFSMQGRVTRAGIPVTLTGTTFFSPYNASTINLLSGNFSLLNVVAETYTITTNKPRYLNVTAGLGKTVAVSASKTSLNPIELRGGNAKWDDNVINESDASIIGANYGPLFSNPDADVNFDGKVNIFDLALVGGNYTLTSEFAYGIGIVADGIPELTLWVP